MKMVDKSSPNLFISAAPHGKHFDSRDDNRRDAQATTRRNISITT